MLWSGLIGGVGMRLGLTGRGVLGSIVGGCYWREVEVFKGEGL